MFKSNLAETASNVVKFFAKDSKKPIVSVTADNAPDTITLQEAKQEESFAKDSILVPEVCESTDFKSFNLLKMNREVVDSQVNALKKAILKHAIFRYGVVVMTAAITGTLEKFIVDGQHLFRALEGLSIPFRYFLYKTENVDEIVSIMTSMNNTAKRWGLNNYVECWAEMNKPDYIEILKLRKEYKVSYSVLLPIFNEARKEGVARNDLRIGKYKMYNVPKGKRLLNDLRDINYTVYQTRHSDEGYVRFRNEIGKSYNHELFLQSLEVEYKNISHSFGKTTDAQKFFKKVYDAIYNGVYQKGTKTATIIKKGAKKPKK